MAPAPFTKTYRDLDQQKKTAFLFGKDSLFSYPVLVRREDALYDGMFVYRYEDPKKKETAHRPHGWLLLTMEDGQAALLAECKAADFIGTVEYPLDETVSMKLPDTTDASKVKRLVGELFEVYEELREFAFAESLSRDEVAAVVRYKDLFMRLCPKGLYPFYHALAPAFFHWLRLPLPDQSGTLRQPEQEDTREYQYQLLILENLQLLVHQFQEKISVDSHKEKLFDELHREVQDYKNGMLDGLTRSMELDVIALIDGLEKSLAAFGEKPEDPDSAPKLVELLRGTALDLTDLLYRQGIDPFTVPGDEVEVSRQTTISTVPTDDPALDRKVCARLAKGWVKEGRVIRPERISVYLYGGEK